MALRFFSARTMEAAGWFRSARPLVVVTLVRPFYGHLVWLSSPIRAVGYIIKPAMPADREAMVRTLVAHDI